MNSVRIDLLSEAIGRILSSRTGRRITVRATTCRNCTHRSRCLENDKGPCKDYEDMYFGKSNHQKEETPGRTKNHNKDRKG